MAAEGILPPFAEAVTTGQYCDMLNVIEKRSNEVQKLPRPKPLGTGALR